MKKILRVPLRRAPRRPPLAESLRAKAASKAETYDDDEDYEVEEEPNMKFSHALIVVLALHVIAVGGVFAFNSIKAGQSSATKASTRGENPPASAPAAEQPKPQPPRATEAKAWKTHTVQAGDTLSRIASLYKVSIEAIEKENGITSYSMIRVGQVFRIPAPESSATKPAAAKPATDPATASAKQAFLAAKADIAKPPSSAVRTDVANSAPEVAKPQAAAAKPHSAAATPKPANAQPSPAEAEAPLPAADGDVYVVAKGDNPYSIAKKFKVSYNELITINDIKDPTRIQIGQKLKIPARKN